MRFVSAVGKALRGVAGWVLFLVVAIALGYATRDAWRPLVGGPLVRFLEIDVDSMSEAGHGDEHSHHGSDEHAGHAHEHGEEDPDVLTVSRQARDSLGIRVAQLERRVFDRTIPIPAQLTEIPGRTNYDVTAGLSGVISQVHLRAGEEVQPGRPLFAIRVVHQDAVQLQLELLDALAETEVVDIEIERLESINRTTPGAVAGSRVLQERYKRRRFEHTIASRRQALTMLGFSTEQVRRLIEEHTTDPVGINGNEPHHVDNDLLMDQVVVSAPVSDGDSSAGYLVVDLAAHMGEHVDAGQVLCRLADYSRLYVVGNAFERDLSIVRRAREIGWPISAVFDDEAGSRERIPGLRILYSDPVIDRESRSARFYVPLKNVPTTTADVDSRRYSEWKFRPGQRTELRIPVQRFHNVFVVPVDAVARHGVEHYVFQASGSTFIRRPVTVLHQGEDDVVLADDGSVFEGDFVATSGAYQLQLALLNRASGPVDPHAGHSH